MIAQLITFLSLPLITRFFTPEQLGIGNAIYLAASIIAIILTLRMEYAIFISSESKTNYSSKLKLGLLNSLYLGIILLCIGISLSYFKLINITLVEALLLAILAYLISNYNIFISFLNFNEKYDKLSNTRILLALSGSVLKITFGYFMWGWIGFIIAICISYISSIIYTWYFERKKISTTINKKIDYVKEIKNNSSYIKYNMTNALINSAGQFIPVALLGIYYNASLVGIYTLSLTILKAPVNLLGEAVRRVYFKNASVCIEHGNYSLLSSRYKKTTLFLFIVGVFGYGGVSIALNIFDTTIFGSSWSGINQTFSILSIWFIFLLCNAPSTATLTILEKHKFLFYYEIIYLIFRIASLIIPSLLSFDYSNTLLSFVLTNVAFNIVIILHSYIEIKKNDNIHR
ncbi:oligosaccharide flippase family protein [Providencia rettgeri]